MLEVPTGLTVMPVLKNRGSGHGLLVLNTGSGSCEAANNATFTAAAVSSLVALRPTALSSRGPSEPFLPHATSCSRRRQADRARARWSKFNIVV